MKLLTIWGQGRMYNVSGILSNHSNERKKKLSCV